MKYEHKFSIPMAWLHMYTTFGTEEVNKFKELYKEAICETGDLDLIQWYAAVGVTNYGLYVLWFNDKKKWKEYARVWWKQSNHKYMPYELTTESMKAFD